MMRRCKSPPDPARQRTRATPRAAFPGVGPAALAMAMLVAGCSSTRPPPLQRPAPAATFPATGDFVLAASMLDTWNAVGQLLVRMDGVVYEGRSQMLGMYVVRYRGEPLLLVTRALVMDAPGAGMRTRVAAVREDGRPSPSAGARELLGRLQQRLPDELARIAAGGR